MNLMRYMLKHDYSYYLILNYLLRHCYHIDQCQRKTLQDYLNGNELPIQYSLD